MPVSGKKTYISLLRGINVSGQKMIKMSELASLYESIGFGNVRTYVQSGNVIFESTINDPVKIQNKIEKGLEANFGYQVKVIIRTPDEIKEIIKKNPFIKKPGVDIIRLYVSFLSNVPAPALLKDLTVNKKPSEEFKIIGKEVYLYMPEGFGTSKLQIGVFEKKLSTIATARNWKTVNMLYELSKS